MSVEIARASATHRELAGAESFLGVAVDRILIEGIHFNIAVGVTEEERSRPQPCRLDLKLDVGSLKKAGRSGDLEATIDYAAVYGLVEQTCRERAFVLLEEPAEQIAAAILGKFRVKRVRLRIRKLEPFSPSLQAVGIEISRKNSK
ncbi:MAG: dihydroneopterin aldolase [Acidobacteriota bacterium]